MTPRQLAQSLNCAISVKPVAAKPCDELSDDAHAIQAFPAPSELRARPRRDRGAAAPCGGCARGAGARCLPAGPHRAAPRRPHRDRLCAEHARHARARRPAGRALPRRALSLPSHRHLLAADGVGRAARTLGMERDRDLPAAVAARRRARRARGLVAAAAAARRTRVADCRRAVRGDADRGAAGAALYPRGAVCCLRSSWRN